MFQPLVLSRRKQSDEKIRERARDAVKSVKKTAGKIARGAEKAAKKVAKGAERLVAEVRERESQPRKFQPLVLSRRGSPRDNPALSWYENTSGKHNKFWEVSSAGSRLTVRWGRIGTKGQMRTKSFSTAREATYAGLKMIQDKIDGGYHYVRAGHGAAARPVETKARAKPAKAKPAKAKPKSAKAKPTKPATGRAMYGKHGTWDGFSKRPALLERAMRDRSKLTKEAQHYFLYMSGQDEYGRSQFRAQDAKGRAAEEASLRLALVENVNRVSGITHEQSKIDGIQTVRAVAKAVAYVEAHRPKGLKVTEAAIRAEMKRIKAYRRAHPSYDD